MSLAIFDLDNTLIAGDSDHAWGDFLVEKGHVDAEAFGKANDRFYQEYLNGTLDIRAYQEFVLEPLSKLPMTTLDQWHREFMQERIEPMMLPKAKALIEQHREAGDELLIITATNRFVTQPIAHRLGIDDLIATEPEIHDGRFTGRIVGTPSFQAGKIERLQLWLEGKIHALSDACFYSDSHNDIPLLRAVGRPIAVDPDDSLRREAETKKWQIISLR